MTFDAISIRSRSEYGRSGKPPATKDFERIARMFLALWCSSTS